MFERFRIKTALRSEVIRLREAGDMAALSRAELLFFQPAFMVAPLMKRQRWTAEQAMVFMVIDVVARAEPVGALAALARSDPPARAALQRIHAHVLAKAQADPALRPCVSHPATARPTSPDMAP